MILSTLITHFIHQIWHTVISIMAKTKLTLCLKFCHRWELFKVHRTESKDNANTEAKQCEREQQCCIVSYDNYCEGDTIHANNPVWVCCSIDRSFKMSHLICFHVGFIGDGRDLDFFFSCKFDNPLFIFNLRDFDYGMSWGRLGWIESDW